MEIPKFFALLAILLVIMTSCESARKRKTHRRSKRNHATCRARLMMRYKMTVTTTWTKRTFPKMFPTYRPHAHWSTLIGRTHGPLYRMWQEGGNASQAVRRFAEQEDAELLEYETGQGYNNVLDIFTAPSVETSAGETSAVLMVDGRHPKVSFMMKIVPSPDWFIGLSSLDLCHRGRWKKRVHLDLHPYDAGTDRGLTFTSPNWPNEPQEAISAITSTSPSHPASSFFYPKHKKLPRLAYVDLELVSEHRLRRTFVDIKEVITTTTTTTTPASVNLEENTTPGRQVKKQQSGKERRQITATPLVEDNFLLTSNAAMNDDGNGKIKATNFPSKGLSSSNNEEKIAPKAKKDGKTEGASFVSDLSRSMPAYEDSFPRPAPRMRAFSPRGHGSSPGTQNSESQSTDELYVDCLVSEWSEWSPCSKTCGFGSQQRSREVTQMPANGGNNCPLLREDSTCGSMRTCEWSHFSFMGRTKGSPFRGLGPGARGQRRRRKRPVGRRYSRRQKRELE